MRRQKELQEVNQRYAEICAQWKAEQELRTQPSDPELCMELEEVFQPDEESSLVSQSILSGTIGDCWARW